MNDNDDDDYLQALISRMFPILPINSWPRIIQYYLNQSLFRAFLIRKVKLIMLHNHEGSFIKTRAQLLSKRPEKIQ